MKSSGKVLAIALLFVGLVLVNFLASSIPARVDATAESIYSLSSGTKALLGKIEEPVTLNLYFSKDATGLPIALWAITGGVLGAVVWPMVSTGAFVAAPINSVGALMNPGAAVGTVVGGVGYYMTR